ncbi:F-box protein At1g10110-like [Carex rostrata]
MTCWSDLAYDVLECITSFLPLTDHHRFSAVCKNWRLVAKQKRHPPATHLPWLVLGDESGTGKRKFYNLSEDRHYAIDIPELYGRYICGSSHGWLVGIDIKLTGILINPFTREFYELPPFPQYDIGNWKKRNPFKNVPIDYRDGPGEYTFERLQISVVHKVVLSHDPKERSDFTVMILAGEYWIPAFWKPGDSSWTVIRVLKKTFTDFIYSNEHEQFVFVTAYNEILALDFEPDPKLYEIDPRVWPTRPSVGNYIVDYSGDILIVERVQWFINNRHTKTKLFNVLRPDYEEEEMYHCSGIGEYALFLGRNDFIVIDPTKLILGCKCKTNSIYFTDLTDIFFNEVDSCNDLGIFNMGDKTFDTFYSPEIHHTFVGAPIWFTPNPW